jgi:hypothetical protein
LPVLEGLRLLRVGGSCSTPRYFERSERAPGVLICRSSEACASCGAARARWCSRQEGRIGGGLFGCFGRIVEENCFAFCRPGGDLLSRVLRRSTIGAGAFHGRVRNGTGCSHPARTTRSAKGKACPRAGHGDMASLFVARLSLSFSLALEGQPRLAMRRHLDRGSRRPKRICPLFHTGIMFQRSWRAEALFMNTSWSNRLAPDGGEASARPSGRRRWCAAPSGAAGL